MEYRRVQLPPPPLPIEGIYIKEVAEMIWNEIVVPKDEEIIAS